MIPLRSMSIWAGAIATACVLNTSALAQSTTKSLSSESVLETIKKRGKLRAGVATFVPWVMRSKDGELIGFEIDIAKKIAADMDMEIEFVPTAFSGIIPALIAGEFDIIMTGISLVPKRNLTVNFSNPYNWGGIGMAANRKLTDGWKAEDFNKSDVVFTVRRGSNDSIASVRKIAPKAKIRQFDDDAQAIQDVLNGTAHAFITAEPKPTNYARDYSDQIWQPLGKVKLLRWPSAFAVRKGDPDILNWLNNWITISTERGFIEERHDYWFRGVEWKDQMAK
jgi:polar amino acid transport system substrate-binding protein